ncbi:Calcineurin-like phosphoesterase superfamily domain [Carpediemonas membranifera]|uniref:Calcineurin-like phosphoesterase superfamily domain n=1 Tax=Carpediemonas membranifera TaxID=201153 RepID=A0A8J6BB64_9EUKA|nr:Calcineurin-like phosphoesterase superfamily domain [Carpediemonas membranifera]|eukprot:KAG9393702.1 Calcineurin-like phosphoesterase superfamily domain [Carpediemonas membranifera]
MTVDKNAQELKILVVTDIHFRLSGVDLLTTYLKTNPERDIDHIFLLGDLINIPNKPNDKEETDDTLRQRGDFLLLLHRLQTICPSILFIPGNHDMFECYVPPPSSPIEASPCDFVRYIHRSRHRLAEDLVICGIGGSVDGIVEETGERIWVGFPYKDNSGTLEFARDCARVTSPDPLGIPDISFIEAYRPPLPQPWHPVPTSFLLNLDLRHRLLYQYDASMVEKLAKSYVEERGTPQHEQVELEDDNFDSFAAEIPLAASHPATAWTKAAVESAQEFTLYESVEYGVNNGPGLLVSDQILMLTHVGPAGSATARHNQGGKHVLSGAQPLFDLLKSDSRIIGCIHGHAHDADSTTDRISGKLVVNPGPLSHGKCCFLNLSRQAGHWSVEDLEFLSLGDSPRPMERDWV